MAAATLDAPRRDPAEGYLAGQRPKPRRDEPAGWRLRHRAALAATWGAGLLLCGLALAIVGYMAFRGIQYLRPDLIFSRPEPGLAQKDTGGILDPIGGTVMLTIIGIVIATPIAVTSAIWMVEYGQPKALARAVESGIEMVAGTPDIVLAIFGLAIFQLHLFAPLSFTASGGGVFGRSFIAAGSMMSLIALPLVFGSTREGLLSIPAQTREASWALGKTKICTIRTVLLPQVRRNIASGATLGMGRIVGDTAIVVLLLGGALQLESQGSIPVLDVLKGTGSTLTSYVYAASPAGEGNAPQKAYAAAFLLLIIVLALNATVEFIGRRGERRQER